VLETLRGQFIGGRRAGRGRVAAIPRRGLKLAPAVVVVDVVGGAVAAGVVIREGRAFLLRRGALAERVGRVVVTGETRTAPLAVDAREHIAVGFIAARDTERAHGIAP